MPGLSEGSAAAPGKYSSLSSARSSRANTPPSPRPLMPCPLPACMIGAVMGRCVPSPSGTSRNSARDPRRDGGVDAGLRSGDADLSGTWSGAGLWRSVRKTRSCVSEAGRSWPMVMKACMACSRNSAHVLTARTFCICIACKLHVHDIYIYILHTVSAWHVQCTHAACTRLLEELRARLQ